MKKVLTKVGAVLLSCLVAFSGMTFSALADTTPAVTVIQAPHASYERIVNSSFKKWNTAVAVGDGIGEVIFKLALDENWQEIKVTDSQNNILYTADAAEDLEAASDGTNSYYFGFPAKNIPKIGDEVLTLSVKYSDDYTYTQSYNVNTYPMYAFYANDLDDAELTNAGLKMEQDGTAGLDAYKFHNQNSSSFASEIAGGIGGKSQSDKVVKITALSNYNSFLKRFYRINANVLHDGDHVVEFDTYHTTNMYSYITFFGESSTEKKTTEYTSSNKNEWYTIRYTFSEENKNVKAEVVKNGVVVSTLGTESWDPATVATHYDDNGNTAIVGAQLNYRATSISSTSVHAFDNYKFMKKIKTDSRIAYSDGNETVEADDGAVSVEADKIVFTMDDAFTDLSGSILKKADGTQVNADITAAANTITIGQSLEAGEYNLVIPSTAKVAATSYDTLALGGTLEIPFEVVDPAVALEAAASINAPAEANAGTVITVAPAYAEGATSASLYFGSTLISDSISSSVRYFIPADCVSGDYELKLVLTYPQITGSITKTTKVKVYPKGEPINKKVFDYEAYDEQTFATTSDVTSAFNWYKECKSNTGLVYSIASDAQYGKVFKLSNNSTGAFLVGGAFFSFYTDASKTAYNSGKLTLEFDVNVPVYAAAATLQITPYSSNNQGWTGRNVINLNQVEGTAYQGGWNRVKLVYDLDNYTVSGTFGNIPLSQTSIAKPASGAANINSFRMGFRFDKNTACMVDNITIGWVNPLYKGASYVSGGNTYKNDKYFACDADSIGLIVSKEYGTLTSGDVKISVNGGAQTAAAASYQSGVISVPLSGLDISEGDTVTINVSYDAPLATDGAYADEPISVTLTAANSDCAVVEVASGKAVGYFAATCTSETAAKAYIASYLNDELVGVTPLDITLAAGSASYKTTEVTLPGNYDEIKLFVWNEVTPLAKAAEYIK